MKQRLLQHLSFAKPLRLALVLSTLLLALPQTAWGNTEVTYTFVSGMASAGTGQYTVPSTSGGNTYNWNITNFLVTPNRTGWVAATDSLKFSNINYHDSGTSDPATTVDFELTSDFTLTGAFVSAEITYCTENMATKTVTILRNEGAISSLLTREKTALGSTPTTISLDNLYTNQSYFNGNKIAFHFYFTTIVSGSGVQTNGSFSIQSIKITTSDTFGLTIAGTPVTMTNMGNIFNDGKASFIPGSSGNNNTNTLTLNGVSFYEPIISGLDNLTIVFQGYNELANRVSGNSGYISSTNTNATLVLKGGTGDCSLYLWDEYTHAAISGFADVSYDGAYLSTSRAARYVTGTDAAIKDIDGNIIQKATITTTPYYPLWIKSVQVHNNNKNNILNTQSGPITATFDPADNTLTLNGITINNSSYGIESGLNSLIINLNGVNRINTDNSNTTANHSPIYSMETAPLTIQKASDNCELTLSSSASGEPQMVKGFSSVTLTNLNFISKTGSTIDATTTKDAFLSPVTIYPLNVGGTWVTETNKGDIFNDSPATTPTASFAKSGDTNILTLSSANFGGMIESALGDLTIHLTGDNIINATDTETSLIKSTNSGTLKFETDATPIGSLSFKTDTGGPFANPISGFTKVEYGDGIDYSATDSKVGLINYPLTIGGTYVNSQNKTDFLGDGTISYHSENNTLTLNGSTSGAVVNNGAAILNIALNGTINVTGSTYAIYTNGGKLNFVKADGASNVELNATCGGGYIAIEPTSLTLGSGLYRKPITQNQTIITDNPEFVIVGDYVITDATPVAGDQGEIRYDATNKILTLDAYSKAYATGKHAIKTGVTDLKVKLIGESTISCISDSAIFHAFSNSASIQLVKNDDASKLTMTGTAFNNFAADKVTYDGLVHYSSNTNNYIAIPTAPTMDVDNNNKVVLTIDYSGGSVATKYSIDYADETADVTDATYSAPFEMAAPGTVTAWVVANGTTTSTVKGKKFGYQGAPLSMMVNEELTPVLIPAIEAGDNIGYETSTSPYTINDASVATIDNNGKITALAIGAATLTTQLAYARNLPRTTILNYDEKFTTQLTVSKVFNVTFAEGANYMIYYNSAHDNLTIPDGMTAAIVTGVASSGTTVETTTLSYIPATSAVLLGKGNSTGTPTITLFTGTLENTTANKLKYVDNNPVTTTGYEYVLYKDEFVKATGSIPDGKCYLDLTGAAAPAPARSLGIDNDGTTDIRELRMENEERDEWYDLQGRRIEQPTKAGLYIKNGKKVIVNTK